MKFQTPQKLSVLAQLTSSQVMGDGNLMVSGINEIHKVETGDITFLIHSNVSIYDGTEIGDNVIIHANVVIGSDAFYYKRRSDHYEKMISCGRVIIHDDVEIGSCCSIDKGVSSDTIIGKGTKLDNHI